MNQTKVALGCRIFWITATIYGLTSPLFSLSAVIQLFATQLFLLLGRRQHSEWMWPDTLTALMTPEFCSCFIFSAVFAWGYAEWICLRLLKLEKINFYYKKTWKNKSLLCEMWNFYLIAVLTLFFNQTYSHQAIEFTTLVLSILC